eukprot:6198236-Pleurochrysis_carterae.AAC.1
MTEAKQFAATLDSCLMLAAQAVVAICFFSLQHPFHHCFVTVAGEKSAGGTGLGRTARWWCVCRGWLCKVPRCCGCREVTLDCCAALLQPGCAVA